MAPPAEEPDCIAYSPSTNQHRGFCHVSCLRRQDEDALRCTGGIPSSFLPSCSAGTRPLRGSQVYELPGHLLTRSFTPRDRGNHTIACMRAQDIFAGPHGSVQCLLLPRTLSLFSDARREAINTMPIPNSVVPSPLR
jgi:hypothetical protein